MNMPELDSVNIHPAFKAIRLVREVTKNTYRAFEIYPFSNCWDYYVL